MNCDFAAGTSVRCSRSDVAANGFYVFFRDVGMNGKRQHGITKFPGYGTTVVRNIQCFIGGLPVHRGGIIDHGRDALLFEAGLERVAFFLAIQADSVLRPARIVAFGNDRGLYLAAQLCRVPGKNLPAQPIRRCR